MRLSRTMVGLLLGLALAGCGAHRSQRLNVIATTTHLSQLAERIGGADVRVTTIIPAGACPGHYDLRPQDMEAAARGGLLLKHGWEAFTDRLAAAAGHGLTVSIVDKAFDHPAGADGRPPMVPLAQQANLMLPAARAEAARRVGEALAHADPRHAADYRRRARALAREIEAAGKGELARAHADGLAGVPVIGSDQQAGLLRWLGMDVVREYGRAEDLTPRSMHEVVVAARRAHVRLVVDNLQSGPDTGKVLAEELGAAHVTLSNFPGASKDAPDWRSTVDANIAALARAAKT